MLEVEALIVERLYPGRRIEVRQPPQVMRRGPGTANPGYGIGVHQDHGRTADDFQHNIAAFTSTESAGNGASGSNATTKRASSCSISGAPPGWRSR